MTQSEQHFESGLAGKASLRRRGNRAGLSLLEVILSIAILGGAMVVIGHLFNLGYRSALQVRIRSDANLLCDSKMAELAAGVIPAKSTGNQTIDGSPGWNYSIDIQPSLQPGLLTATVTVQRNAEIASNPTSMSIVRFLPDPDYDPEEVR